MAEKLLERYLHILLHLASLLLRPLSPSSSQTAPPGLAGSVPRDQEMTRFFPTDPNPDESPDVYSGTTDTRTDPS